MPDSHRQIEGLHGVSMRHTPPQTPGKMGSCKQLSSSWHPHLPLPYSSCAATHDAPALSRPAVPHAPSSLPAAQRTLSSAALRWRMPHHHCQLCNVYPVLSCPAVPHAPSSPQAAQGSGCRQSPASAQLPALWPCLQARRASAAAPLPLLHPCLPWACVGRGP